MTQFDFDLLTIGAGSGGVRASRVAAKLGVRVGLVEGGPLGGTCVNVGCVPKKLFWYAAHYGHALSEAQGFGWSAPAPTFDWPTLKANKDREIKRLNRIYDRLLTGAEVTQIHGWARVTGPHEVTIETPDGGTVTKTAERILVTTGGVPWRPAIHGAELGWDSDDMFALEALPDRIAIMGGGYIAVEFASILAGLGVQVTLIHRGAMVLTGFDHELRHFLGEQLRVLGVDLRLNHTVVDIERGDDGLEICTDNGGMVVADGLLFATGRRPNTANLGLEAVGVELDDRGHVQIDAHFQTAVPSIYALGDVVGRAALTPVAIEEAMVLVRRLFQGQDVAMDYANIPTAVFSEPPCGTVGITEHEARKRGEIDVYVSEFRPMAHTLSGAPQRTFMKCIVDRASQRVLGFHMVGDHAGEIIQGLGVAMKCGVTKAQLDATVGIHPTAAEEFVTMREARVEEAE